jgi:hypothetical protein
MEDYQFLIDFHENSPQQDFWGDATGKITCQFCQDRSIPLLRLLILAVA